MINWVLILVCMASHHLGSFIACKKYLGFGSREIEVMKAVRSPIFGSNAKSVPTDSGMSS